MRIHALLHADFEGLGSIENWSARKDHIVSYSRLYASEPLPDCNDFDLAVVMGGPMSIRDVQVYPWLKVEKQFLRSIIESGKFVLGICLGAQLAAEALGGNVYPGSYKEIGWFPVKPIGNHCPDIFTGVLSEPTDVFHWHRDTFDIPAGSVHIAGSKACPNQGFIFNNQVVGLQFHLETTIQSAEQLILNCEDELVEGPFITSVQEMLAVEERFRRINLMMDTLLNNIEEQFGKQQINLASPNQARL
jgi:GMP synthase-like glutamine amidotransferase